MDNDNLLAVIQKSFENASVNPTNVSLLIGEFVVDLPDFSDLIMIKLWEGKDLKYFITVNRHPDRGDNFSVREFTTGSTAEEAIEKLSSLYTNYGEKEFIFYRDF